MRRGALLVDTPGMRELGLYDDAEGIEVAYADVTSLAEECRFRDCAHRTEPGCAVAAALKDGRLDPARFAAWRKANPERAELLDRVVAGKVPAGLDKALPTFEASDKGLATRAASGKVLTALADVMPELWGGSADLAGSNNTTMDGQPSFTPKSKQTDTWKGDEYGRTLHFGIRENGMGMAMNGIALEGLTRVYGGTFLVFSDYMRPAVRLASLQQLPVTYVWTHDSIGLGEDGPTHQPIEHLASLRAMPNVAVYRPADAVETAECWELALADRSRPSVLALSRQNLPPLRFDIEANRSAEGGYRLVTATAARKVVLVATGSEVAIAVETAKLLEARGVGADVVSLPSWERLAAQPKSVRDNLLPGDVLKVSIEAGSTFGWERIVGSDGLMIGIDGFGASAPAGDLYQHFGLTPDAVSQRVLERLNK